MSYGREQWMAQVESITENYCASDQMPEDFQSAMARLVRLGLKQPEATTLLQDAIQ